MRILPPFACACVLTGCFNPPEPADTEATGSSGPGASSTLTTPEPMSSGSTSPEDDTTVEPDGTTIEPGSTSSTDGGESSTSTDCAPGTYGPDCSGVCDCNGSECNDGLAGDGSCTCLPGTFGSSCAGQCSCGAAACDDGASGTGLCVCPDPAGTFTVAYLPGWGSLSGTDLAFSQIQANWANFGDCQPTFVPLPQPFTAMQLAATNAHVVLASNPSGAPLQYSAAEILAVRDHVMNGNAGFVSTYLLRFQDYNNAPLADLAGVDPLDHMGTDSIACESTIDVVEAEHPLMTGLPASFDLVPVFSYAQDLGGVAWADALLPGAEIVAQSSDELSVVVAHEGADWRGTKISTFPEYQSTADGRHLLYNALLWSSYPPSP
jgi:hypothetical protein